MGKSIKLDNITSLFNPLRGEVYYVPDEDVQMTRLKEDILKGKLRTVLIVCSTDILNLKELPYYNIIPLTTKGNPDSFCFPIAGKYKDVEKDFKPDKNSLALLPFFQPIRKELLISRCGIIEDECYQAIVTALCMTVIGYDDYDLEP